MSRQEITNLAKWIAIVIALMSGAYSVFTYAQGSYVTQREMNQHVASDEKLFEAHGEIIKEGFTNINRRLERIENKIDGKTKE